jgi:hypothetical protein
LNSLSYVRGLIKILRSVVVFLILLRIRCVYKIVAGLLYHAYSSQVKSLVTYSFLPL